MITQTPTNNNDEPKQTGRDINVPRNNDELDEILDKHIYIDDDNALNADIDDLRTDIHRYTQKMVLAELKEVKNNHPIVSGFHSSCHICSFIADRITTIEREMEKL